MSEPRFDWEAEQRLQALEDGYERFREMDRKWKRIVEDNRVVTDQRIGRLEGRIAELQAICADLEWSIGRLDAGKSAKRAEQKGGDES